ncbi:MAG: hypothetical protein V4577_11670 [Bacteroidota bacterium]
MKLNLLYLSALVALAIYGCGGGKKNLDAQPIPDGTYSGEFRLLHIHSDNRNIIDTQKTNLTVYFAPVSTGTFTVTGDTTTLHAGSKGSFIADGANHTLFFIDNTYPKVGTPAKTHLSGSYAYQYDGSALKIAAFGPQDTLALQYDLKKTGN